MNKKFEVNVGVDFDKNNEIKVTVALAESHASLEEQGKKAKVENVNDWKKVAISWVGACVFASGTYSCVSGDHFVFTSIVDAVVKIALAFSG